MGAETRGQLVRVARNLIHEATFADVSVDEVCKASGVNKGSLYHFFPSKDALGMAVLEENWTMMSGVLDRAFEPDLEALDRIDRFIAEFEQMLAGMGERFGHTPGCPLGNMATEFSTQDPKKRRRISAIFDEWAAYFSAAIAEAQLAGDVAPTVDVDDAGAAVVAYIQGLATLAKTFDDPTLMTRLGAGARQLASHPTI